MRNPFRVAIPLLFIFCFSCATINIRPYLTVRTNTPYRFKRVFVRSQQDLEYKIIESNFGNPNQPDTVEVQTEIFFDSILIENEKAYYPFTTDQAKGTPRLLYGKHFLHSVIIYQPNRTLFSPVIWSTQLPDLKIKDFSFSIPNTIKKTDTLTILDEKMGRSIFYGFNVKNLTLDKTNFKKCLVIDINRFISGDTLREQVWISKSQGVLLWVKGDGIADRRVF